MTEADWLTETDCTVHLSFVSERLSTRRQRLLAVGFCRAVAHFADEPYLSDAITAIEQCADGTIDTAELGYVHQRCREIATQSYEQYRSAIDAQRVFESAGAHIRSELAWAISYAAVGKVHLIDVARRASMAAIEARVGQAMDHRVVRMVFEAKFVAAGEEHAKLSRAIVWEVVGNPFRPVDFTPWRTDTAIALARTMYESREYSAMPILADALQDAGCDNEDVLNHCRGEGPHVRGCWVVDGVLGKE